MKLLKWKWPLIVLGIVFVAFLGRDWIGLGHVPWSRDKGSSDENAESAHDHAHEEADENKIQLSDQAIKNLGLDSKSLGFVRPKTYRKSISVPAIVAQREGRTQVRVSSPLNGVMTTIHAVAGEAVEPGQLLFDLKLIYEDLVDTQTQFLKSVSDLEVEKREIKRLEEFTQSGAVSAKAVLDHRYAKEKLEGYIASLREGLKLHGLSDEQVDTIERERKLLSNLAIEAPALRDNAKTKGLRLSQIPIQTASFPGKDTTSQSSSSPLIVEELRVQKGQGVTAGETLCTLSDYSQLFVVGSAFEQDASSIANAIEKGWNLDAVVTTSTGEVTLEGLKLSHVGNTIDEQTRSLAFYVELPNELIRDERNSEGQRFVTWKYRVGQRMRLLVPVEEWQDQIVLPVDAVAKDGVEWFVFRKKDNEFERVSVHIKHRDLKNIVIENDGRIARADVIAYKAAHQLQMALKNKATGGVDAHHGHDH
jgi:membrane fusion protein, heavy metal efflux system